MLKQSPSRIQRSKGFKVKHFLQICLLLAICIWLLNQLKHSYDERNAYAHSTEKISEKLQSNYEGVKLGRKGLHRRVDEAALEIGRQKDKTELEEEIEEMKPEDVEDDARGGGDDEIDGHDQERAEDEEEEESEEVEDLIDVDDRDRDLGSDQQEGDEKGKIQLENASNDRSQNGGERTSQEAREELYEGDGASSLVEHKTRTLSTELKVRSLRKIKVTLELGDLENAHGKEIGDEFDLSNSNLSSESSSHTDTAANDKSEVKLNSRLMLVGNSGYRNENDMLSEIAQGSNATTIGGCTFLQTVSREYNRSSKGATESGQSNVDSTISTMTANLDAVDAEVATAAKSVVTKQMLKFDAANVSERNNGFAAINKIK